MRESHNPILVSHGDMSAEIDELLAPMIKLMWELGIKTKESCQGIGENWAAIYFDELEYPRTFLQMAFDIFDVEEHKIVLDMMNRGLSPFGLPFDKWKMWCHPRWHLDGSITFSVTVEFPKSEINNIVRRLESVKLSKARFRSGGPDQ